MSEVRQVARIVKRHDCDRCNGIEVKYVQGWRTRGSSLFNPRAVVPHHTASNKDGGPRPALGTCTFGRPDLSPPLCNFHLGRDARVTVVAAGKANHAGLGGPWGTIPQDSANALSFGIEAENNGIGEPWSDKMIHAYAVLCAACLYVVEARPFYCFGHKEWTSRKIDPFGISMGHFRRKKIKPKLRELKQRD